MRDIGKNIRAARVRRSLIQGDLAEQLEVDMQILLYGEPVRPERRLKTP